MYYSFSEAEQLLNRLPRAQLGFFPTPLYKLGNLSKELGVEIYIKRDDFTGMSLFGGNKVRKLEYLLGLAVAQGCDYAITYGATQSNHAMETVACCRRLGIRPIIYLTAVVKPDEKDVRGNLLLDRIMDAEIHIVDILPGETEDEADARAFEMGAARARELTESGHPCMDIPMGGANVIGSVGFAMGYVEMMRQAENMNVKFNAIYHSTGTGGTMAGLHAGRGLIGDATPIYSVSCSLKNDAYYDKVEKLANDVLAEIGAAIKVDRNDLHVDIGYYMPGYEMPNAMASEAIRLLARTEGLFIDPVYTGKAFAGMIDHIRKGDHAPGSKLLFWHTGGATALFAEREILGEIF